MSGGLTSTVFGCLRVNGISDFDPTFLGLDKLEQGNHLHGFSSKSPKPFDYWHGGLNAHVVKQLVPARNTVFTGFNLKIRESPLDSALTKLTHSITAMRQDIDEDLNEASFLDKVYYHIYPKLTGRLCISLDFASAVSQFVLVSRDTTIYLTSFCDHKSKYLMWSNEHSLERRMREHFGERFFFYRHVPLINGVAVIQSNFLSSKMTKWASRFSELATMNALDGFLQRKTRLTPIDDEGTTL